jgi:hypothetical protein
MLRDERSGGQTQIHSTLPPQSSYNPLTEIRAAAIVEGREPFVDCRATSLDFKQHC